MKRTDPIRTTHPAKSHAILHAIALACVALGSLAGCASQTEDQDIELPSLGEVISRGPDGVFAVIREADIPLYEPTDDAWAIIEEDVTPPSLQSAWLGNGLRVGILRRDQLDAYEQAMPEVIGFSTSIMNQSSHPVPIIETPQLRSNVYFQIDLTRPPYPLRIENITGGANSTLRLLARIETDDQGRHSLVLIPQHYIPSPLLLVPRDPLEKELDGRVYEELAVRVTLGPEQIAVVGLNWPWPVQQVIDDPDDATASSPASRNSTTALYTPTHASASDDPGAPPAHINPPQPTTGSTGTPQGSDQANDPEPRYERVAPPLPTNFGSTLFTGTRIRQPVRIVLLITIEEPAPADLDGALDPAE